MAGAPASMLRPSCSLASATSRHSAMTASWNSSAELVDRRRRAGSRRGTATADSSHAPSRKPASLAISAPAAPAIAPDDRTHAAGVLRLVALRRARG